MPSGNVRQPGPALVLLSGLPGAGKTTFAHALREHVPADHIESDAIRRRIFPAPAYTTREHAIVFREAERLVRASLREGRVAILDATNLTRGDRQRFFRAARGCAAFVTCVRIVAPEAVLRERLAAPRDGYSQADTRVLELMAGRAETFRQPLVVVDSRAPLGPSLHLVARLLQESAR